MMEDWTEVPFAAALPNWRTPVGVTTEFRTWLFEANTGDEQRRAHRQQPRRSISYEAIVSGEEFRRLLAVVAMRRDNRIIVPDVVRSVRLAATVEEGDDEVVLGAVPDWVVAGAQVFLHIGSRGEVLTVDEVDGLTVTFTSPATDHYWDAKLSPGLRARLPADQSFDMATSAAGTVRLDLEIDPGSEVIPVIAPPEFAYRGHPFIKARPNWKDGVDVGAGYAAEVLDYGNGLKAFEYDRLLSRRLLSYTYLARSREAVAAFEGEFHRAKGRRGALYLPSWTSDFELLDAPNTLDNSISVRGDYRELIGAHDLTHRVVCFIAGDVVVPCGIKSAVPVAGGVKLMLDRSLGDIPIPSTPMISWLFMVRFASDSLTIDWVTDEVAQIACSFEAIRESFFALEMGGLRIMFGGDYLALPDGAWILGESEHGGGPPPVYVPSLDFSDERNSQYTPMVF